VQRRKRSDKDQVTETSRVENRRGKAGGLERGKNITPSGTVNHERMSGGRVRVHSTENISLAAIASKGNPKPKTVRGD